MTSTMPFTSSTATSTSTATPSCISVTPDKNGYVPEWACNANYNYYPSFAAAVAFSVLFGLTLSGHIIQTTFYKKWKLCWSLLMGILWEFSSFIVRSLGSKNQQSVALSFTSQILVLLAPMWINAFVYMVLGRMIYFFIPEQKVFGIKGIKVAKVFVWLDIVSFLTQVGGGVMISPGNSPQTLMTGIHIYMGGIGFQQGCIVVFAAIAVRFWVLMRKQEQTNEILDRPKGWMKLLCTLFVVLALITTRIVFRLDEFAGGLDPSTNPVPFDEVYFLVLDAGVMLVACVVLNAVHPGSVLVGEGSEFPKGPTRKEKKALKRMKKEEKRQEKERKKMEKEQRKIFGDNAKPLREGTW